MLVLAAAVIGLAVGSFANVLIVRVPAGKDWVRTPSACVTCGEHIRWRDNVPLLSYAMLRGRCRQCKAPISRRYPLVEAAVATVFVAVAAVFGASWTTLMLCYLAVVSVILAAIDLEHRRLPHAIVVPSIVVLAIGAVVGDLVFHEGSALRAAAGASILAVIYGVLWFVYPKGMGFGDVTTALMLGIVLGFLSWAALAVGGIFGPLLGGVVAIAGILGRRLSRRSKIAYGPFLLAGAWVGIFAGEPLSTAYLELLGVTGAG